MTESYPVRLGQNITTNSNQPTSGVKLEGGQYTLFIDGVYDGADVSVYVARPNSATFSKLTDDKFTESNYEPANITLGADMKIYVTVANVGGSTSLNATLFPFN